MLRIEATIKQGYRVGSGTSAVDPRFNEDGGTIRLQSPEFKKRGLDCDAYFGGKIDEAWVCGTLGCDLTPRTVTILKPEYHFTGVRWTDKHDKPGEPPVTENFFLSPAQIEFGGNSYKALLYIPDPATKPGHFHPPTTLEVIAQKVPDIAYGDRAALFYNPGAVQISE
ncbi:MAG: hypothetical protein KGI97_00105 [Alphaproteobacteria bacterium]|nr:hypothetical protein [Alphaproteobacteria bacterium]